MSAVIIKNGMIAAQKQENEQKYGIQGNDVIAMAYMTDIKAGHAFCAFTAIKYLRRFAGKSLKANNPKDLEKAMDFVSRMMQVAEQEKPEALKIVN